MGVLGVEPKTLGLKVHYSNQLSYTPQNILGISTGQLKTLQFLHPPPIQVVIFYFPMKTLLEESFSPNDRLSLLDVATRRCPCGNNRNTRDRVFPVLSY